MQKHRHRLMGRVGRGLTPEARCGVTETTSALATSLSEKGDKNCGCDVT